MWYILYFFIGVAAGVAIGAYMLWKTADTALKNMDKQLLRATAYYEVENEWVKNLHNGNRISSLLSEKGYKNIAIYGYAELGRRLYEELAADGEIKIAYIIDQNADKVASDIDAYKPTAELPKVDAIIVTPVHIYSQISTMLKGMVSYPIVSLEDIVYDV